MNKLMRYIQIVIINIKERVIQKSLYTMDILIRLLTIIQIVIVFWVFGLIS